MDDLEAAMLSLPTLSQYCRSEIQRNVALWADYGVANQLCFNQCGEHGTCTNGMYHDKKQLFAIKLNEH